MPSRNRRPHALRMLAVALLAGATGAAVSQDASQGGGDRAVSGRDSARSMDDTWIATRVKTELLASRGVSGLALNVETTNGVVSLTGELGSQSELDKAVQVARGVDGVVRVDTSGIRISADADR